MSSVRLRYLLFVGFTLVSVVPVIFLGAWVQKPALQKEIDAVNEKHLLMAKKLASALDRYVTDVEAVFRFTTLRAETDPEAEGLAALLDALHFRHVCIIDQSGQVLRQVSSFGVGPLSMVPKSVMQQIEGALKGDDFVFTGVGPGPGGLPSIYVAMPLTRQRLAIGALSTGYLRDLQSAVTFGERGHAAIVDHTGKVLSHPNRDWIMDMKDLSAVEPVKRMMAGETGVSIFYSPAADQDMVAGYTTVPGVGWGAMIPQPMSELEQSVQNLFGTTLKIVALGVLGAAVLSWWLAGYLSRPVLAVAQAARDMADGKPGSPVSFGKMVPTELRSLTESFNSMVRRISAGNEALRDKSAVLQATLDHMAEGITMVNEKRELVLANQRFADFFELPAGMVNGPTPSETIVESLVHRGEFGPVDDIETEVQAQLENVLRPTSFRVEHTRPDGCVVELRGIPLPDGGQVTSYVDVTERKRAEQTLRNLQKISAAQDLSFDKRLRLLLETGCRQFNLPIGILSRVHADSYHVVQATTPGDAIEAGAQFDLSKTYCQSVLQANTLIGFEHAGASEWRHSLCYREAKLEAYMGMPVVADGEVYGTLNFSSFYPHTTRFTRTDKELLGLMAQWVGGEIARECAVHALFEEKERALVTLHSIGDAVITASADGMVRYLNPIAESLTGWTGDEARGEPLDEVLHIIDEQTRARVPNAASKPIAPIPSGGLPRPRVLVRRDQNEFAIEESVAPIRGRDGELLGVVLVFRDVTPARHMAQEMTYQATHDALTGLVNRREFERRLERVLDDARTNHAEHALCYMDLDQFKVINDTCGHVAGDALLRQLGMLLPIENRECDTLARLGGDEFGVLMEHCPLPEAKRVAGDLLRAIEEFRFLWHGNSFTIGASIGLVPITETSGSITSVLSAADSACYAAKDQGRNRVHVYHEDDQELAQRHGEMRWVARIPQALDEDRFQLSYQPIVPVNGKHCEGEHYELLLRMEDDDGHMVPPGAFLPAAERYGLATKLDHWVINTAFDWLTENPEHLDQLYLCSINICGHSLGDAQFLALLTRRFNESPIAPGKICFEITETLAIANLASATHFMSSLKALGCRFALDDFGSGLSSFAYLKNLPVDFLKIDGLFVKDIVDDPIDLSMVRSINEIGHVMGKQTLAEFVENDAIRDKLREIGVDYAQGYGVGRPRPLSEMM